LEFFQSIEKQNFECDILLVTFIEGDEFIFQIEKSGHIQECDNFGIIGDGTYVAEAFLYLRACESSDSVGLALYEVIEAMTMAAQCVSTVSKIQTFNVVYPPGFRAGNRRLSFDTLTTKGEKFFQSIFNDRFGWRKIKDFPETSR